jgi:TP901 family phage tail tape measure protein
VSVSSRDLVVRLMAQSNGFEKGMKSAAASADVFAKELEKIDRRQTEAVAHVARLRAKSDREASAAEKTAARDAEAASQRRMAAYGQVGKAALVAGTAVAAGVALSVKAAVEWESAWAGVAKTVDGNAEQMAVLEGELRQLATTLPASHAEIAAVAEAAGQLGIKREDIAGFTKVMIDLGETTNLTADQAATSMAQLANIMGTSAGDVDRMGAALVALGNNGASTEAQIVEMALRIAGAGRQVGLTEADVFAMSNALASVGINAEAGGSAISRFMSNVSVAVVTGSDSLDGFASVAGMTVQEFSRLFEDDAARAVGAFTDGLGRIQSSGGSAIATLEAMGVTELRLRDTLLRLAGAQGLLGASLDLGSEAWEANNALVEEADKRYATTQARMQVARNAVNDLAIDLGSALAPAVAEAADSVGGLAELIAGLPGPVKGALGVVAGLTAGVLLTGGAALVAVPKIVAFKASVDALALSAPRAAGAVGLLGRAMGAAGLVGGAVAIGYALGKLTESILQQDAPALDVFSTSLLDFVNKGRLTGEAAERLGDQFGKLGYVLDVANSNKLNIFDGNGAMQINEYRDLLKGLDETLASLVQNGHATEAAQLHAELARRATEQGHSTDELNGYLTKYGDAVRAAGAEQETATAAAQGLADAVSGIDDSVASAFSSLGAWAEAMGYSEEATKELTKQVEEWAKSYAGFVKPLGTYTSLLSEKEAAEQKTAEATAAATSSQTDSWEDYATAVSVSVAEYLAELEKQVAAQRDWSTNMLVLSSRVSEGTLDELARMGPEGAPLVAQLVNASDAEIAKLESLFQTRTKAATGALASELLLARPVLTRIAAAAGQDTANALARELAEGRTTVAQIAAQYGVSISGGIIPPISRTADHVRSLARGLEGLDGRNVSITVRTNYVSSGVPRQVGVGGGLQQANGSLLDFYARGGIREQHVAQIAPAGAWRVWAEPETGGEAYIPLSPAKRARSIDIWHETGRRLDVFAAGGFSGLSGGAVSASDPRSLTTATRGLTNLGEIASLVRAWRAYNEELEQAARLRELLADEANARADIRAAKTAEESARAHEALNAAMQATTDFQYAAARGREAAAVERQVEALEAAAAAEAALAARTRERQDNKYELGLISDDAYLQVLQQRMDAEERFSDGWMALWRERKRILQEQAAAERALTDALKDELDERQAAHDSALDRLNGLLDREDALRARQGQAVARYAAEQQRVEQARLRAATRFGAERAQIRSRQAAAERQHLEQLAVLAVQYAEDEQRILAGRRSQLANATALDEQIAFQRGLPADWLIANAQRQVEALTEWMDELALARRLGVSEQVIEALGLADGPQTLAQVRALTRASAEEIDALNAAAAERTRVAGEQVRREQVGNLGQLGQALTAAQQQYTRSVLDLQARYRTEQERLAVEMLEMQARYAEDAQRLREELAAAQQQLLADQAEVANELARLGEQQGRAYGEAIAEGLRSSVPAVRAAAAELAEAMAALDQARSAVAQPTPVPGGSGSPFKRHGFRQRTYDSGGWLEPGFTLAYNGTGQPERIFTAQQLSAGAGAGERIVNLMPGAHVTVRESVDVDLLVQRAEFLVSTGSFG